MAPVLKIIAKQSIDPIQQSIMIIKNNVQVIILRIIIIIITITITITITIMIITITIMIITIIIFEIYGTKQL